MRVCDHCKSEIEKDEQHLPMTGNRDGKEVKYCEVRQRKRSK